MRFDELTPKIWRHGIGFLIAFDAVQLVIRTRMRAASLSNAPLPVPPVFRALALSTPGLAAVALVGVIAAYFFARGRASLVFGLVALAANRGLLEAYAALDGIYEETSYHAASAMLGWIAGLAFARVLAGRQGSPSRGERQGTSEGPSRAGEAETLAALGAAAMFGATYLNAGTSKLQDSGISWADSDTIRLLVLSHHPAGVTSWLDAVRRFAGQSASVAMVLSIGTLVIQCGAFLFPWTRRTRLVWGSLFVAFHTGIFLVAGSIFFLQAVFLAVLFAVPWSKWLARSRALPGASPAESPEMPLSRAEGRRAVFTAGAFVAGLVVLVLLPIQPRRHPIERLPGSVPVGAGAVPVAVPNVDVLGPLRTGTDVADGWILRQIAVEPERVVLTLARGEQEVVLDLTAAPGAPTGRFDTGSLHVSYRQTTVPPDSFSEAGESVARKLTEAAAGQDLATAFQSWVRAARR